MIEVYLKHEAERKAQGIPPKPLDPEQTRDVCKLLESQPSGREKLLLDLLENRVSPGVDPEADVLRSIHGAPLARSESTLFRTVTKPTFVEPRRLLVHGPGPLTSPPGLGDEDGCLNAATNSLYVFPGFQTGTDASAVLLCLTNEGGPHVVPVPVLRERAIADPDHRGHSTSRLHGGNAPVRRAYANFVTAVRILSTGGQQTRNTMFAGFLLKVLASRPITLVRFSART